MLHNIFPISYYCQKVKNFDDVQEEVKQAIQGCSFEYKKEWGLTHKLSNANSDWNECVLNKFKMINLIDEIKNAMLEYAPLFNIEYSESWITRFDYRDYAHVHSHSSSLTGRRNSNISGVYYYQLPPDDKSFYFVNNTNNDVAVPDYKTGYLILFPSSLSHGVNNNTTDIQRYSLSFNLYGDLK